MLIVTEYATDRAVVLDPDMVIAVEPFAAPGEEIFSAIIIAVRNGQMRYVVKEPPEQIADKLLSHQAKVPNTLDCWFRTRKKPPGGIGRWEVSEPKRGRLFCFTSDFVEFEGGPGHFPVAVIEDILTRAVHVVPAEDVSFAGPTKEVEFASAPSLQERKVQP